MRDAAKHPLWIALPLFAADQLSKQWIINRGFEFNSPNWTDHPVINGFFYLVYWGNTGSAFSMFPGGNYFFIGLSLAAFSGLLIFWSRGAFREPLYRVGVGLLLAGILGNVTDRFIHHYVVDFLVFDLKIPHADPWPAFNIADSCICTAVGLFFIASFNERKGRAD